MNVILLAAAEGEPGPESGERLDRLVAAHGAALAPFPDPVVCHWRSPRGRVRAWSFVRSAGPHAAAGYAGPDDGAGWAAWTGWLADPGAPERDALDLIRRLPDGRSPRDVGLVGEYLVLKADSSGRGLLARNLTGSVPLHAATTAGWRLFSNRVGLLAALAHGTPRPPIDLAFLAGTLGVGWPLVSHRTLFRGVEALPQGTVVRFGEHEACTVERPAGEPWRDEGLREALARDPRAFWDGVLAEGEALGRLAGRWLADGRATLALSGGKDSRLLLALLLRAGVADRLGAVRTVGPPWSNEVLVAHLIARRYGLPVRHDDPFGAERDIADRVAEHLLLTEGVVGVHDLIAHGRYHDRGVALYGQEAHCLREVARAPVASADGFRAWSRRYHDGYDALGVLAPGARALVETEVEAWIDEAVATTADPADLPARQRLETRYGRWAASVGAANSAVSFVPHLLATDGLILAAYNAGAGRRRAEALHYELLARVDPWLADTCPLAGEGWPASLAGACSVGDPPIGGPVLPQLAPGGLPRTSSAAVLAADSDRILGWLLDGPDPTFDGLVDPARMRALVGRPLGPRALQCFGYLVQARVLVEAGGLDRLAPFAPGRRGRDRPVLSTPWSGRSPSGEAEAQADRSSYYRDGTVRVLLNHLDRLVVPPTSRTPPGSAD